MRTKSFSVKKLLSLVLAIAMMATIVLPTSVFAAAPAVNGDAVAMVLKGTTGANLIKQITVTFDSEIKFDEADFTDANVTVDNSHELGGSTASVDPEDARKLIIALADDATVKVGDKITFANDIIKDKMTETETFNGDVEVKGSLTPATVVFNAPVGVTVTVEGGITEFGVGTYTYSASGSGFEPVSNVEFEIKASDLGTTKNITVAISEAVAPKALKALATDEDGTAKVAGDKIYVSFSRPTNRVVISAAALADACAALGTDASAIWKSATELEITVGTDATIKSGDTLTLDSLGIKDENEQIAAVVSGLVLGGSFGNAIKPRVVKAVAVSKTGHSTASEGDQIVIMFNTLVTHNNITVKAKDGSFGTDFDNENKDATGNNEFINWKDNGVTTLTITLGSEPDVELNKTAVNLDGVIKDAHSATLECENIDTIKIKDGSFGIKILPELVNATIVKVSERPTASENDKVVLVFSAPTNGEDILSYLGGTTLFGGTATGSWNAPTNTVYTIKLGGNATIEDGNNIVLPSNTGLKDQYDIAEVPAATKVLAGSFGNADAPKLLTATIIKTSTNPEAQENDEIVLVFSSRTNGTQIASKVLVNGNSNALGSNVSGLWSLDNTVYTIKLGTGNKSVDDGDTVSVDATCGLKDYHSVVDFDSGTTAVLAGSFGEKGTEIPQIVSAVATSEEGSDFIKISFNIETNLDELNIDDTLKASLMAVNAKLGDITVVTKDSKTLKIKLGETATIKNGDVIDLAPLGIKSKSTDTALTTATIECSGYTAPVVKDIVAENGGIIKVTFTTRTNKATTNLEPSAALYGEGATASWSEDAKTLTITLGIDYGITERGYISLDNLGIKDGYSGSYVVSGQYKIQSGSFTSDALEAKSAIAKSSTTTVTDAVAGDKITITFSYATDKNDSLTDIISEVKSGDTVVASPFGTGATCEWVTSRKLVITLGDAPEIKRDDVIYFNKANIRTLSGQELTTESIDLKGSFDGRDYYLSGNYVAQTATAKDHSFKVVVDNTSDAVAAKPTIVCVAYNGNTPVAISRVSAGIDETAEFVFTFSGSYTITNAKVYAFKGLFDDITDTTASPEVLAETKNINK